MDRDRVTRYPLRLAIVCIFRMFVSSSRVPSRISVKVLFVCVCTREQKRVNFVRVFRAEFSLKRRYKKGGTLHSFEYFYYYYS